MLITRTPLRIPLGGGGTDLPSYYSRYSGFLVTAAINKYVYILLNPRFEDSIRVSYSETEIADRVQDIRHPLVREALRLVGIDRGLEIVSVGDVPANTGLGSSSSFTVGLLNALHTYKGERVSLEQLAEEAYTIEVEILKEPIGKQDQYIAAFGGIRCLEIAPSGRVSVSSQLMPEDMVEEMEDHLLFFYTGIHRRSSEVLAGQSQAVAAEDEQVLAAMHQIKSIGHEIKEALEVGDLVRFGGLLHRHWETKKRLSERVSTSQIDRWYDIALEHGALGGKIMGAGGGGFFMLCCNGENKSRLRRVLATHGLRETRFSIELEGSKMLVHL